MSFTERLTAIENRVFDALRSPDAMRAATEPATGDLDSFRGRTYCVLVSYRRDGTPVPSPVWFALHDGRLYVHTGGWKVKRVRANPRVRVAPCTFRGKPVAAPIEGGARVVPMSEADDAEAALVAKYGLRRRLYYATLGRGQHDVAEYIEITPRRAD